jgi:hypothetical protein
MNSDGVRSVGVSIRASRRERRIACHGGSTRLTGWV